LPCHARIIFIFIVLILFIFNQVWFRDLPVGLYNDIPQMTIYKVAEMPYDAGLIMQEVMDA
jgi:hypothetical protein